MTNPIVQIGQRKLMQVLGEKAQPIMNWLVKMRLPEITVTKISTKFLRQEIVETEEVWQPGATKSRAKTVPRQRQVLYTRALRRVIKEKLHGATVISPTLFRVLVNFDMYRLPQDPCPRLAPMRLDLAEVWAKSIGLHQPGTVYTAIALPHFLGQHAYICAGNIGMVSEIAAKTGLSREVVLLAFRDPLTYLTLWKGAVAAGGVQFEWSDVRALLEGRYLRAKITIGDDPIRLSGLAQQMRNTFGSFLLSINARTEYGHALIGTAQHNLLILDGEQIVYIVIGVGGHWSGTPGDANIAVACWDKHGMWPGTIRNLRRVLDEPNVIRAVIEGTQSENREQLTRIVAEARNPDTLYALVRALAGNIVRVPSAGIGTLMGQRSEVKGNWRRS